MAFEFNFNHPIPLLILGDGPDQPTGLGRIGRDIAGIACGMPEFRVGYLGRQAFGRARFPWQQYSFSAQEQWGEGRLLQAYNDLSAGLPEGAKGVVLTIWDASRLLWLADPMGLDEPTEILIRSGRFERWGYFMADGEGVQEGRLPMDQTHVMQSFDRVALSSKWGYGLAFNTLHPRPGIDELSWLPHPIDQSVFYPRNRLYARSMWSVRDDQKLIGCVMANQARKHWPVVLEAMAQLPKDHYLWVHTDTFGERGGYWNLTALIVEYGLQDRVISDMRPLVDEELALRYSGCDATVVVSGGEGFCYPVAESLSCGVPVVAGGYGAHAELAGVWAVRTVGTWVDTRHNVRRAQYRASELAHVLTLTMDACADVVAEDVSAGVKHLDLEKLRVQWQRWFRRGIDKGRQRQMELGL